MSVTVRPRRKLCATIGATGERRVAPPRSVERSPPEPSGATGRHARAMRRHVVRLARARLSAAAGANPGSAGGHRSGEPDSQRRGRRQPAGPKGKGRGACAAALAKLEIVERELDVRSDRVELRAEVRADRGHRTDDHDGTNLSTK